MKFCQVWFKISSDEHYSGWYNLKKNLIIRDNFTLDEQKR